MLYVAIFRGFPFSTQELLSERNDSNAPQRTSYLSDCYVGKTTWWHNVPVPYNIETGGARTSASSYRFHVPAYFRKPMYGENRVCTYWATLFANTLWPFDK